MKLTILVTRITRVIETDGAVGDGAELAQEYAAAVANVNSRLEAVHNCIDAKQDSDAVRMMEDPPRLLDEISILDFNQLPEWEALCSRNGWALPAKLDKALLERILIFSESTEMVEPLLRMYRKAVRTNNDKLAVQSLRRLAEIDHSQNWKANLVQAEEAVQKQIIADFQEAKVQRDEGELDRLAQELLDTDWSEPPKAKGVEIVRAYVREKKARQRNLEGAEDLAILKRCLEEKWNRQLAFSMLMALDRLSDSGFVIPMTDREAVEACRRRCAKEMEAEEKEKRWKNLCENLHGAIQQENTAAIRDVLASPEFLDREPDPELVRQARLVIRHEEAARRRKMMQIAFCIMAGLLAILSLSGWWLKKKLFNDRCSGEAVKLATLQDGAHAVDRLSEALKRLHDEAPDVYADPRVNVFAGKLKTMIAQNNARTNEIASALSELRSLRDANWGNDISTVTSRFEQVASILAKDDDSYRAELAALKSAWADYCESVESAKRDTATKSQETLVSHAKMLAARLKTELSSEPLDEEVAACKESIEEWKRVHAQLVPTLEGAVDEAAKTLADAENMQKNLQAAISKVKDARTAESLLEARKTLVEYYSSYPFVKDIGEHPVAPEDARAVSENATEEQKAYARLLTIGVDDGTFMAFIEENVMSLVDIPSFYSLYGLVVDTGINDGKRYIGMSKGKPRISKSSYSSEVIFDGEILDLEKGEMLQQMTYDKWKIVPSAVEMPSSVEIKSLVEFADNSNLTLPEFEYELLRLVKAHLKAAMSNDFAKKEVQIGGPKSKFKMNRYPAIRRVQLMQVYFSWLKDDLKVTPESPNFARWLRELKRLAQPVIIDNIPEDLTWTYMPDARVRQRNAECAEFLAKPESQKIPEEYMAWENATRKLRKVQGWKIGYAGCNAYNPQDARWMEDHSTVLPFINGGEKKDHPLYLLRRENGKLVLKKALVPSKDGSSWMICSGKTKEFVPGDPLFHVAANGKCIDAEEAINELFSGMPENIAERFIDKIPFFGVEVKKNVVGK